MRKQSTVNCVVEQDHCIHALLGTGVVGQLWSFVNVFPVPTHPVVQRLLPLLISLSASATAQHVIVIAVLPHVRFAGTALSAPSSIPPRRFTPAPLPFLRVRW